MKFLETIRDRLPAIAVIAVLGLGLGVIGWRFVSPSPESRPAANRVVTPDTVKLAALSGRAKAGKTAFDENCAACHGDNATGTEQGPPLLHDTYNPGHHDDNSFLRAVKDGVPRHHWNFGDMAPQPQVSRNETISIIEYVREMQRANGIFWRQHRM
ncbi:MAG: cytochrome c [Rhodospirillales bacterium]